MTNREFYTKVIETVDNEELIAKATEEIAKLDSKNAKRSATPSKATVENVENRAKVVALLTESDHPMTAKELSTLTGFSVQKIGSLLTGKNGVDNLVVTKVKGDNKGKVNAYSLA